MVKKKRFKIGKIAIGAIILIFTFQLGALLLEERPDSAQAMTGQTGTLVVNGVGEVHVKPDMATILVGAQATAASASEAQSKMDKQLKAIKKVLKEFGVKDDHIQTASFHVYPNQMMNADGTMSKEQEYRAEHMLEVQFSNIDRLGGLIDAVSKAGANRIDQIRFGLQNQETAEHEALQKAIEKTATKADVMAKSAGKKKGEVLQIADQAAQVNFPYADTANFAREEQSAVIEAGEIKVVQRVDVVYQLK